MDTNRPDIFGNVHKGIRKALFAWCIDLGRAVLGAREAGLLFNGGGHAMAAGFTVTEANLPALISFVQEDVGRQLKGERLAPTLSLDGALAVSAVTPDLVAELECVSPFGAGNEEPRFAVVDAQIAKADVVGSGHVRCFPNGRSGGRPCGSTSMSHGRSVSRCSSRLRRTSSSRNTGTTDRSTACA